MENAGSRLSQPTGTLLLVDDEENIISSLRRLLRRDGYRILTALSGKEALEILSHDNVDIIISDQRMPNMMGTEFLQEARKIRPNTIRIVLSGYTELGSVTSAINDGAVYKFLTKPWDDEQLRSNIAEAFQRKLLDDENLRLQKELAHANIRLLSLLEERRHMADLTEMSLIFSHEMIDLLPIALIGIDANNLIVLANELALALLEKSPIGGRAQDILPIEIYEEFSRKNLCFSYSTSTHLYQVECRSLGHIEQARGYVMTLSPLERQIQS